jgi:hypothetical protein
MMYAGNMTHIVREFCACIGHGSSNKRQVHFPVHLATSIAGDNFFPDVAVNVIFGGAGHVHVHLTLVL